MTLAGDVSGRSELVILRADDAQSLADSARRTADFLSQAPSVPLRDVAYTCSLSKGASTLAIVAQTAAELGGRLSLAASRIASGAKCIKDKSGTYYDSAPPSGGVAFVFPGGYSFYPDMMRDLAVMFPVCRGAFDELEEALAGTGRFSPASFVFPPAPYYRRDADVFSAGGYAEALVSTYSAGLAAVRLLAACGVKPAALAGFSGGDLAALAVSGMFGKFARRERLEFLRDMYAVARRVAAGMPAPEGMSLDLEWLGRFKPEFRKFAKSWIKKSPEIPVYSCATASTLPEKPRHARDEAAALWTGEIRFEETAKRMYDDGFRIFVEAGPRSVLSSKIRETLRSSDVITVATDTIHRRSSVQFMHAVAQLASAGVPVDAAPFFEGRRARALDLSSPLSVEIRSDSEMRLSRDFPHMSIAAGVEPFASIHAVSGPAAPGSRAKSRAAAAAARDRRQRQLDFGTRYPLVSDAEIKSETPGERVDAVKTFSIHDCPFFADFALGTSQISYSDGNLRGFLPLALPAAAEIMAEFAARLVPNRRLAAVDDLQSSRTVSFESGRLVLSVRAERTQSPDPACAVVKASIWECSGQQTMTAPACSAIFTFRDLPPQRTAFVPEALKRPRSVHWIDKDIYPGRLHSGEALQRIRKADLWSEDGLDYDIEVPALADAVAYTRFPQWELDPRLLAAIADGFPLWRSHERFAGAFSLAFRLRHISVHAPAPAEGAKLKCYLRIAGVTPKSQIADIRVSDGNGTLIFSIDGYEELTERAPEEFCRLVLSPSSSYLTRPLSQDLLGDPATSVATAWISDIPYGIFERNSGLWLQTVSHIVLGEGERRAFREMPGTVKRRAEWLFGRIAAKEAVRRFLAENYQARWNSADIQIWADDQGKPHALGAWSDYLTSKPDIAISHTKDFAVAAAASNARVGIDVEYADRDLTAEFTQGAFSESETAIAAESANAPESLIRFWCAKECVSKALGTGIRFSPKEMRVESFDPASGEISIVLDGQWLGAFKSFKGRAVGVKTVVVKGHVLASCFIPETFFR